MTYIVTLAFLAALGLGYLGHILGVPSDVAEGIIGGFLAGSIIGYGTGRFIIIK